MAIDVTTPRAILPKQSETRPRRATNGRTPPRGATKIISQVWPEADRRLVEDDEAPAPALELDALPARWGDWIVGEAEACSVPRDYVAGALIGTASAWVGNARHVAATADWREHADLWIALVGVPSTGKSPFMRPEIEATRTIERAKEPAWREECSKHAAQVAEARLHDEKWQSEVRDAFGNQKSPPDRPSKAEPPPSPSPFRLMAMDVTTEELQRLLAAQPRGLLYVRDELAGWLGAHDRYGGNGADRAFFNEAWNGGEYVADRVKHHGVPVRIPRTSLAILGGLQPDLLRQVLAGADDGLVGRFIYIWPAPAPIAELSAGDDAAAVKRRETLVSAGRRLVDLAIGADAAGAPPPKVHSLDRDAFALFQMLRRDALTKARASRGLAAGWHGKTPTRALRLALVYEMLRWSSGSGREPSAVSADAMARAGRYLDYAGRMFDRVTAGLAIEAAEADAAVIARGILAMDPAPVTFNERELYQRSAWLRDRVRRNDALSILAQSGWIRQASAAGKGRPRGDWDVNPRLFSAGHA